jgi:diguanylate cyclase (GGDEF)-like protein/PAS domain S-box-containing protein
MTLLLDADGIVESATAALTRLLGYDPVVVWGRPFADLVSPEERALFAAAMSRAVDGSDAGGLAATAEVNLARSDGTYVPIEMSIVSLLDDPVVRGLVVSCHDITRLRAAQSALSLLAHRDPLTGLLNRRSFDAALQREWQQTQRDGIDSYVVMVDLDGFKAVNDAHGHAAGDEALRVVAAVIDGVARDTDVCARLGGDEFGVILVRCGGEASAIGFCDRLDAALAGEVATISGGLRASCGYQSLRSASSPTDALHQADLAMFHEKANRPPSR